MQQLPYPPSYYQANRHRGQEQEQQEYDKRYALPFAELHEILHALKVSRNHSKGCSRSASRLLAGLAGVAATAPSST